MKLLALKLRPARCLAAGFAIVLAVSAPCSAWPDSVRSSASYGVQFDVIGSGGGGFASASYSQPQTVIGQSPVWAVYSSPAYQFEPVGTFLLNPTSSVAGWSLY